MNDGRHAGRNPRGFTLIEIVVVIAIIGILSALALLVGNRVTQGARINSTKDLLRILEKTQDNYNQDRGGDGSLPYKWADQSPQQNEFAVFDGRINPTDPGGAPGERAEPSTTFYLLATKEAPSVQSAIGSLDSRYVVTAPIGITSASTDPNNFSTIVTRSGIAPQPATGAGTVSGLVIKDPWGNAIRYVHPKFQGGYGDCLVQNGAGGWGAPPSPRQPKINSGNPSFTFSLRRAGANFSPPNMRRSFRPSSPIANPNDTGDADEGLCAGGRGYFYSVGPDKDAGTREDNVYTIAPQFPSETARSSKAE